MSQHVFHISYMLMNLQISYETATAIEVALSNGMNQNGVQMALMGVSKSMERQHQDVCELLKAVMELEKKCANL